MSDKFFPKNDFVFPDYNNSLINVVASIEKHFGLNPKYLPLPDLITKDIKDCCKLVFFLIDGFGMNIWNKFAINYPTFAKINSKKKIVQITSIFPSTTAAVVTTIDTGLLPKNHGILEWHLYLSKLDLIIKPLPFEAVETEFHKKTNLPNNLKIEFSKKTIYEKLKDNKINCFILYPMEFINGHYAKTLMRGAKIIPYENLSYLFSSLTKIIKSTKGRCYYYIYWPNFDTAEHIYGPFSKKVEEEIRFFENSFRKDFLEKIDSETAKNTALFLTSDHGIIGVNPRNINYINKIPNLISNFKIGKTSKPILPVGNTRDVMLFIKTEKVDETCRLLEKKLKNKAEILLINEKIITQLFGNSKKIKPEFLNRLGNVLILPRQNHLVWYKYKPEEKYVHKGMHGGLSKDEMLIPFISCKISELID